MFWDDYKKNRAMKKHVDIKRMMAVLVSMAMLATFTSCDKEPVNKRPELPPVESLVMDFGDFSQQPAGMKGTTETYENFMHAYGTVLFWNVASAATLALPAAAYASALHQEPEYLGDHTWEWSFDLDLHGVSYGVVLTGTRLNNEEFSLEMVIYSSLMPEDGMKWFDGLVRYDHTHAAWNLYGEGGIKKLEAKWNKDYETKAGDLTYTYVEPDHEETGSFITYAYMPGEMFDASFTSSLSERETVIEWNTSSLEGRIRDASLFGDSEWHCWDAAANGLTDKVCE
jgi:hypothetical protein